MALSSALVHFGIAVVEYLNDVDGVRAGFLWWAKLMPCHIGVESSQGDVCYKCANIVLHFDSGQTLSNSRDESLKFGMSNSICLHPPFSKRSHAAPIVQPTSFANSAEAPL